MRYRYRPMSAFDFLPLRPSNQAAAAPPLSSSSQTDPGAERMFRRVRMCPSRKRRRKSRKSFSAELMGHLSPVQTLSPHRVSGFRCHSALCLPPHPPAPPTPPRGEGSQVKVQIQLAEWSQKAPGLSLPAYPILHLPPRPAVTKGSICNIAVFLFIIPYLKFIFPPRPLSLDVLIGGARRRRSPIR